jgi:predicted nucleic acid-binding protein
VIIPKPSYDELSNPTVPHLKQRVDYLINSNQVKLSTIEVNSDEYELYIKLTNSPDEGHKIIGRGEAASIILAKKNNGIVASNNIKDIQQYIQEFNLKHITTGDILYEALSKGYITEVQGNLIWASMIAKRRKLGASTFSEFIKNRNSVKAIE